MASYRSYFPGSEEVRNRDPEEVWDAVLQTYVYTHEDQLEET